MRIGILYKLVFPNGKAYIGITRESLDQRIRRHIQYARSGRMYALSYAIRKYGEKSFVSHVLGYGNWSELKILEINAIENHRNAGILLYNMTDGGEGSLGVSLSKSTKEKISNSLRGRKLSEQHRKQISDSQKGKVIPQDVREKMRAAALKRCSKPMSDEQKQKIRASLVGKKQSPERVEKRVKARIENGSY